MSTATGAFIAKYGDQLKGTKGQWVAVLSEEDRRIWASLGRMATSEQDINWHSLGGKTRAAQAKRNKRGRFWSKEDGNAETGAQ